MEGACLAGATGLGVVKEPAEAFVFEVSVSAVFCSVFCALKGGATGVANSLYVISAMPSNITAVRTMAIFLFIGSPSVYSLLMGY